MKIRKFIFIFFLFVLVGGCYLAGRSEIQQQDMTAFKGFVITTDGSFTILENPSVLDDRPVIRVPLTVENTNKESKGISMFDYKVYNGSGSESDLLYTFFSEDNIHDMGNLRTGIQKETAIYFTYDGDGMYIISFGDKLEFEIPIAGVQK